MSTSEINEEAFEALIEKALVGSTIEEREAQGITKADVDAQQPTEEQFTGVCRATSSIRRARTGQ